jgi:hypothetical protein
MGWFNFTVSMPSSEAKPEGRYRIFSHAKAQGRKRKSL